MTIDEAIKNREDCLKYLEGIGPKASPDGLEAVRWSVKALKALRPVSREQVEKVWRGEWVHKRSPYDYKIFVCKKCEKQISIQGEPLIFCPACGAAQTDEAVQMVMERLEALYEDNSYS